MKTVMEAIHRQFVIAAIGIAAITGLLGIGADEAHATLIGDPAVTIQGFFNNTLLASDTVPVVTPAAEVSCPEDLSSSPFDLCSGFMLPGESINIEADSILFDFVGDPEGFPTGTFVGFKLSDLGPGSIIGVTLGNVANPTPGFDISRVSFTADSVSVNFQGLVTAPGQALIQLQTPQSEPVPEPSTIALLSTGLVGLLGYGWHRRKSATETSN